MGGLDLAIILAYFALMLAIGVYASRRQRGTEDYFVAGRRMGVFSVTCLWLSSWIGGASISGTASRAYSMALRRSGMF